MPTVLHYAPAPDGIPTHSTVNGWLLIGYDQLAPVAQGAVTYRLARERSRLRPHPLYERMEQGTAVYVFEA